MSRDYKTKGVGRDGRRWPTKKKASLANDTALDKAVFTWFNQQRSEGLPISGSILESQAKKFNEHLNHGESFEASRGWLMRFKNCYGIAQATISGDLPIAHAAASAFPEELKRIIEEGGYCKDHIYNCDETALYYKMLPDKTLATKNDDQ